MKLPDMNEVTPEGVAAEDVPAEVADYIEKAYARVQVKPDARFRLSWGDEEDPTPDDISEAAKFEAFARAYCQTRTVKSADGKSDLPEPLTFRRLSVKDDDDEVIENVVQFRVSLAKAGKKK